MVVFTWENSDSAQKGTHKRQHKAWRKRMVKYLKFFAENVVVPIVRELLVKAVVSIVFHS